MGHALGAWEVRVDDPAHDAAGDSSAVLGRARRLAADVLVPAGRAVDSSHQIPPAHLDLLAAQGFYGVAGPREYGGLDVDFRTACRVIEVLAGGGGVATVRGGGWGGGRPPGRPPPAGVGGGRGGRGGGGRGGAGPAPPPAPPLLRARSV